MLFNFSLNKFRRKEAQVGREQQSIQNILKFISILKFPENNVARRMVWKNFRIETD